MARILLVDDEECVLVAIQVLLEHRGYTVVVAGSGPSALRAIKDVAFDAAVVDLFMPGLDGLDVIKVFRERAPDMPIIAMSGHVFRGGLGAPDLLRMAADLGVARCLRKPFRPDELVNAIEQNRPHPVTGAPKVA
jgi:CheY-like chemotaxis protein